MNAITTTEARLIAEYDPTAAALAELRERYANVIFPVQTKDGMKDAKEVRQKLVKLRTGLEKLRKEIKEPALRRTQAIDAEARDIERQIREIEEPIDAQIKAEEQRAADEKAAKEAAERARVDEIRTKMDAIRRLPLELAHESADAIRIELDALTMFEPTPEMFGEFVADATGVKTATIEALANLLVQVRAREEVAATLKAEQERLMAERAALEAEKYALAQERAALAAAKGEPAQQPAEPEPVKLAATVEEIEPDDLPDAGQPVQAPVTVADWTTRRLALATADQFTALASKVEICGFTGFGNELRAVAYTLREGDHDSRIAQADFVALLGSDFELLDATSNCIEALREKQRMDLDAA